VFGERSGERRRMFAMRVLPVAMRATVRCGAVMAAGGRMQAPVVMQAAGAKVAAAQATAWKQTAASMAAANAKVGPLKSQRRGGRVKELSYELMEAEYEAQLAAEHEAQKANSAGPEQLWVRRAGELKRVKLHKPYPEMTVVDLYIAARRATGEWFEVHHHFPDNKPLYNEEVGPVLLKDVYKGFYDLQPPAIFDLVPSERKLEKMEDIKDRMNELVWEAAPHMPEGGVKQRGREEWSSEGFYDPKDYPEYAAYIRNGGIDVEELFDMGADIPEPDCDRPW